METLKPIEISEYYINRVTRGLEKYFWDNLFSKIFEILKSNQVVNDKNAVLQAIKSGRIYYENGAFRTTKRFSNAVAKGLEDLGAKFKYNAYYIKQSLIPAEYAQALAIAQAQALTKATQINTFLVGYAGMSLEDYIEGAVEDMYRKLELDLVKSFEEKKIPVIQLGIVSPKVKLPKSQTKNIEKYWEDHEKQVLGLQKEIGKAFRKGEDTTALKEKVAKLRKEALENVPQLDLEINDLELDAKSKKIAQDYTYNMKYWVKNWEVKNIAKMRQEVLDLVQKGARVPTIEQYFLRRWKVARDKARFLAINESHLAGSVIKATQYQMAGCTQFKWTRSSSREKRKLHEEYYNKVFDFDNPPIIDEKLGITGLPRQIWNCKCHMSPVVPDINTIMKVKNAKRNIIEKIINSKQCNNNAWRYRRFG